MQTFLQPCGFKHTSFCIDVSCRAGKTHDHDAIVKLVQMFAETDLVFYTDL